MAIPTFPHPSLYVGDFNCQHVSCGYNKTSPCGGESLDAWATSSNLSLLYHPKETASFFSHWWNVGTNPDLAFASFCQQRHVQGKLPWSQHRPSLIMPLKLKVPAQNNLVKHWNFRKADWKRFCLLTDESIERLPHHRPHQLLRGHTRTFMRGRAYFLRPNNVSHVAARRTMCHVGTKSARPSVAPLPEPQWRLALTEPLRPYYLGSGKMSRSDGWKQ